MNVLGVDPGFAAFGYALATYNRASDTHALRTLGVIRTKKSAKQKRIMQSEDNFQRARDIASELVGLVRVHDVKAIAFESFSPPMKASKMNLVKIGFPYGILAAIAAQCDLPTVQMSPQFVRKVLCATSKADTEHLLRQQFTDSLAIPQLERSVAKSMRNHAWDALAAYMASWETDTMRMLRNAT